MNTDSFYCLIIFTFAKPGSQVICTLSFVTTLGVVRDKGVLEVVVVVVLGVLKPAPAPAPCITPAIALPCPFEQIDWALDGF